MHSYTFTLDKLSRLSPAHRYFMHSGGPYSRQKLDKAAQQALDDAVKAAERRTAERAIKRTTERGPDGRLRFVENPPTMMHLEQETARPWRRSSERYRSTVNVDIELVISVSTSRSTSSSAWSGSAASAPAASCI